MANEISPVSWENSRSVIGIVFSDGLFEGIPRIENHAGILGIVAGFDEDHAQNVSDGNGYDEK